MKIIKPLIVLLANLSVVSTTASSPQGNGKVSLLRRVVENDLDNSTGVVVDNNSTNLVDDNNSTNLVDDNNSTNLVDDNNSTDPVDDNNSTNVGSTSTPTSAPTPAPTSAPTSAPVSAPTPPDSIPESNKNEEVDEDESEDKEKGGSNIFVYFVVTGMIAFGGVMYVRHRRRKELMRNREIVMGSSPSKGGHLNELYYDNDII